MGDIESISPEELGNLGVSEIDLKSNGVCHVEDVYHKSPDDIKIGATIAMSPSSETVMSPEGNGSSSPAVTKRHGLRKWRRIPRELVKSPVVNGNGNSTVSNGFHGDSGLGDEPDHATRVDSDSSEDQNSRSSYSASRTRPKLSSSNGGNSAVSVHSDDQKSNGQTENNKKARGFNIDKENSDSNMGNFVFVQGTNSVASKSRLSGSSVKYEEEYGEDDDKHLNNDAESEDVSQEDAAAEEEKIEKHEGSFDQDALVESITNFDSAIKELQREVEKWKDIGKDEPLTIEDSINDILEVKNAMIKELESTIIMGDTKSEIDDLLKEKIQTEVEIVAITTTTKSLISGPLNEMKLNLQPKNVKAEKLDTKEDVKKVENKLLKKETEEDVKKVENKVLRKKETEDVKKLQNRVCRLSISLFDPIDFIVCNILPRNFFPKSGACTHLIYS